VRPWPLEVALWTSSASHRPADLAPAGWLSAAREGLRQHRRAVLARAARRGCPAIPPGGFRALKLRFHTTTLVRPAVLSRAQGCGRRHDIMVDANYGWNIAPTVPCSAGTAHAIYMARAMEEMASIGWRSRSTATITMGCGVAPPGELRIAGGELNQVCTSSGSSWRRLFRRLPARRDLAGGFFQCRQLAAMAQRMARC